MFNHPKLCVAVAADDMFTQLILDCTHPTLHIASFNEAIHDCESKKCNYCQAINTIEHHLFYCKGSKAIWNHLEIWLDNQDQIKLNLTVCEVLFGLPFAINEYIELINFVIILS